MQIFFPNSSSFGVFSHSKGFGPELLSDSLWFSGADPSWAARRFFGRFHQGSTKVPPKFFKFRGVSLVSQSPAVFWANGCCFRKGSVEGSANYSLHLSPKWLLLHKGSLEGSANCALHLSPSLLLGSKLRELLTCLTHTNPVRRKRRIMSLLLGYSLGLLLEVQEVSP